MQPPGTMAVRREFCHPIVERAYAQELLTEEQRAAQVVGGGLRHDAQIGVDRPAYRLAVGEVHFRQVLPYALHRGIRSVDAEWLDVGSHVTTLPCRKCFGILCVAILDSVSRQISNRR